MLRPCPGAAEGAAGRCAGCAGAARARCCHGFSRRGALRAAGAGSQSPLVPRLVGPAWCLTIWKFPAALCELRRHGEVFHSVEIGVRRFETLLSRNFRRAVLTKEVAKTGGVWVVLGAFTLPLSRYGVSNMLCQIIRHPEDFSRWGRH